MKSLAMIDSDNHEELNGLIGEYNQLLTQTTKESMATDEKNQAEIKKIFILQKISYLYVTNDPDQALLDWHELNDETSIESHLQHYHIHRDGSALVKNVEFSAAVDRFVNKSPTINELDYFTTLQKRDALLRDTSDITKSTLHDYITYNQTIQNHYQQDKTLQEKYLRSLNLLARCYAKMEAIKGKVDQNFAEYSMSQMNSINNKNFKLEIAGDPVVIRVESREDLGSEQLLQTYPVSAFFSEDYYTMMHPFNIDGNIEYRPVVLSEFAEQGSLQDYAESLIGRPEPEITSETQRIFNELSHFCIQLMDTNHYHADIKLSNVLQNKNSILAADRKAIIDKRNPKGLDVASTPIYAPPEYQKCLVGTSMKVKAINPFKAAQVTLDMPSFMSYQLGMALKEFLLTSMNVALSDERLFRDWQAITYLIQNPSEAQKNLIALVQALTQENPSERLPITILPMLLLNVNELTHKQFMQELAAVFKASIKQRSIESSASQSPATTIPDDTSTPTTPKTPSTSSHSTSRDSGSFIQLKSAPDSPKSFTQDHDKTIHKPVAQSTNHAFEDSGSVIRKPTMQVEENDFDSGSLVRTDTPTSEKSVQGSPPDNEHIKRALTFFKEEEEPAEKTRSKPASPKPEHAEDIDTTIHRGSGKFGKK